MRNKLLVFITISLLLIYCVAAETNELPLEEHKMLKMDEGVWNAKLTMWKTPGAEPIQSDLIETNTMLGDLWSIGKMEGNISGTDYVGFATLGYNPIQKKYVGTWVDSVTPEITQMIGNYKPKSKTLTLYYSITDYEGKQEKRKNIMVYKDKNIREFETFVLKNDKWNKSTEILYTRID